jgi:hypothetical protein
MMCAFEQKDDMRKSSPKVKSSKAAEAVASTQAPDPDRQRRIAELAYTLGARRGFTGDTDEAREDWLEAERIVDKGTTD